MPRPRASQPRPRLPPSVSSAAPRPARREPPRRRDLRRRPRRPCPFPGMVGAHARRDRDAPPSARRRRRTRPGPSGAPARRLRRNTAPCAGPPRPTPLLLSRPLASVMNSIIFAPLLRSPRRAARGPCLRRRRLRPAATPARALPPVSSDARPPRPSPKNSDIPRPSAGPPRPKSPRSDASVAPSPRDARHGRLRPPEIRREEPRRQVPPDAPDAPRRPRLGPPSARCQNGPPRRGEGRAAATAVAMLAFAATVEDRKKSQRHALSPIIVSSPCQPAPPSAVVLPWTARPRPRPRPFRLRRSRAGRGGATPTRHFFHPSSSPACDVSGARGCGALATFFLALKRSPLVISTRE